MTTTRSPFKRRGFIAAAIIVGIILLAAIVVLVTTLTRPNGSSAIAPTALPNSSSSPAAGVSTEASICGLRGLDVENKLTAAPSNSWLLVGTVAAPNDPTGFGPGIQAGGSRSCYSHTAEGALFAAVNYIAIGSDSRNLSKLSDLLAPGKGKDAAVAAAAKSSVAPSDVRLQVAGFKVNSYSPDEAVVDVAWTVTSQGGALVSYPTVLDWVDGDWKIVLSDDGQPPFASSPLTNLGGYIPWSGV